ncbi:MAG TPA: FAD-dependent oxidoreductase [Gemmatimonadales bacterium]|jgi:glycerol-3-phosphate dehydrogenase|nr:FAD-dependent oxidoreductase [Gemmatimonadales bacterium]
MPMRRDLDRLAGAEYDVLVIGGGIQGACIAWDAALRGLRVALVERDDFGAATSANSLRIVHGGIRYLARGDLPRMRESIRERSALLRVAPGLVEPLPVLIPTGPPGVPGRLALGAALALTHLLSPTRNRHLPPDRRIGAGRVVSRLECLRLFPALDTAAITGGALWYDARMTRPERLTLAFITSAASVGARVANHAEATAFDVEGGEVRSVEVVDHLSGRRHRVRGRQVVIAAGPWTEALARRAAGAAAPAAGETRQALALNLVIGRRLADVAVGLRSRGSSEPDPGGSGGRFLFLAPQEHSTLLGTWYAVADAAADPGPALESGMASLLAEFNLACPGLQLSSGDVVGRQWGRLPLKAGLEAGPPATLAERPRIGGRKGPGPTNLLTVEAVKYTTARAVAQDVVDLVLASMGIAPRACRTAETPLVGAEHSPGRQPPLAQRVLQAARGEMAVTLSDIVYRRTELGDPPGPERERVRFAARIAADALGWDEDRRTREEAAVLGAGAGAV